MKLRMAENSLFAILLRSRWWISLLIALGIGLAAAALLPAQWRLAGALSGMPFIVIAALAARRQWHQPSAAAVQHAADTLGALPWPAFEGLLTRGFEREGYRVKALPIGRGGAGGADLELERSGRRTLVAARRWKSARIGVEALKPLLAAREAAGADAAIFIGLGELSEQARPYAAENGLQVWQAAELAKMAVADAKR
jgi:restriction system protein